MKKNFIRLLIILMSFSLLGIIAIQYIWITNAIEIKGKQFDQNVNNALNQTVKNLEQSENVQILSYIGNNKNSRIDTNIFIYNNSKRPKKKTKIKYDFDLDIDIDEHEEVDIEEVEDIDIEILEEVGIEELEDINISIEKMQQINWDSIAEIMEKVTKNITPEVIKNTNLLTQTKVFSKKNTDSINIIINEKSKELSKTAQKLAIEFRNFQQPINERLENKKIQKTLKKEFRNKGINLSFSYKIKKSKKLNPKEYKIQLFPNDIIDKDNYLTVSFFNRQDYILSSISWLLVVSALLTIFIILTFIITIFIILRQKKISEMKSDFINNMTHEFKTPIATISVAADTLRSPKISEEKPPILHFTQIIKDETKRMNRQVENILQIARLEKKSIILNCQNINIHEIINNTVKNFQLQIEQKKGEINLSLIASNYHIEGDNFHITNMISNLLDNANKYTKKNPKIKIETSNLDNGILISVIDNGIGMNREVQKNIFKKFYRETSGNIHNIKGFGLGLSYVKAIVELHKGWINVKSKEKEGSQFDIFIPYN